MNKYGALRVVELRKGAKHAHPTALCICDCGRTRIVRQTNLRRRKVTCCAFCSARKAWQRRPRRTISDMSISRRIDEYKGNAIKKKIRFALTFEECKSVLLGTCKYCGSGPVKMIAPKHASRLGGIMLNGIDRIDNELGYEIENVVSCCAQCNYAKRDMPLAEFLAWARRLASHQAMS